MKIGLAIDLGTSGIRIHSIDLEAEKITGTTIALHNPIPGANVIDHLHFALIAGEEATHRLLINAVNKLIDTLGVNPDDVRRVAVCGNPIQLSIFQGIPLGDLAYADAGYLKRHKIKQIERDSMIVSAESVGLPFPNADVYIPPAVKREIGADTLAMIIESGLLKNKGPSLVIDYGTNAEMALKVDDTIFTGSAAAGPAIEGEQIKNGILASPGAISDFEFDVQGGWRTIVLDDEMMRQKGDVVDILNEKIKKEKRDINIRGITGTGVIALIAIGLYSGVISPPKIRTSDHKIHLPGNITFDEEDLKEAGKAIGAIRAGYSTLALKAGIKLTDITRTYMAGASGTYVDALKARRVGLIFPSPEIYQIGNTSLMLARDLVMNPDLLSELQNIAEKLRSTNIFFPTSKEFEDIYLLELGYWTENMPIEHYIDHLNKYGYDLGVNSSSPTTVNRLAERDIPVIGENGLKVVRDIGVTLFAEIEHCTGCKKCERVCPERALEIVEAGEDRYKAVVISELCNGASCLRCVDGCPLHIFNFEKMISKV